jgi:hypothetical protein
MPAFVDQARRQGYAFFYVSECKASREEPTLQNLTIPKSRASSPTRR